MLTVVSVGHYRMGPYFHPDVRKAADKHACTSSPSNEWMPNVFYGATEVVPSGLGLTEVKVLADDGGRINAVALCTLTKEITDCFGASHIHLYLKKIHTQSC